MIFEVAQSSFTLTSRWSCNYNTQSNGSKVWKISSGPTQTSTTIGFEISLPADAKITRSWLEVELGSPLSGAKVRTINGDSLPSTGLYEINNISASTVYWTATFVFKANGKVFEDLYEHSASLSYGTPTLRIEYTSDSGGSSDKDNPTILPGGTLIREKNGGLQLPRLLKADLSEERRLYPSRCSITLNLHPLHTATMYLNTLQEPGLITGQIPVRSFVELFTPIGSAGIFRVTDTDITYGNGEGQTLYLESALNTLKDDLVIGVQAMTGKVSEVFASLLEAQTVKYWDLGDCEVPDEYELIYDHTYDNILQAITKLLGMLPDEYYMELDTLVVPFQMHIRKLKSVDECEMRLSRNMRSVSVTLDSRELCTRLYPFGNGEGTDRIGLSSLTGAQYMDSDTIRKWGVVAKTWTNEEIFDSITLQDVAQRYLEKYKNPILSIEAQAMELSQLTGQAWDRFVLGSRCRVALPEYKTETNMNLVYNEIVIGQDWADVYGDPENVKVTLANRIRDAADEIADFMREATSSKLIGGSVTTDEIKNNANNITSTSPYVHYFNIEDYGNVLAARVMYTCTNQSTGASYSTCEVAVDGTNIEGSYAKGDLIDILPYLRKDASGIPLVGEHYVRISPIMSGNTYRVSSTVVLKKIERK